MPDNANIWWPRDGGDRAVVKVGSTPEMQGRSSLTVESLIEALMWCSGSADFGLGGQAREGWLKLCQPLIDEWVEQQKERRDG